MIIKKMFLIFGAIGSICTMNLFASPLIGEIMATADGYIACPPDCAFQRNGDGGLVSPQMCVDSRGVECGSVVRHYDEYPTHFYVGEEESNNVSRKSATLKKAEKLDSAAVARVAKVGSRIKNNTATVTPVTPLTKESEDVDKVAYIYGGKKYECPWRCHWVRDDAGVLALPPKCVDANGADCTVITVNTDVSAMAQVGSVDELDVEPATTGTENVININSKKLDKTSVSRAARTTKTANKAVSAAPKTPDKLGGVVLTYRCPEGCTSSNAGGSSGQTNGAFVAACVDAAGNECEVIWEVTETNTSASPARVAKVGPKVKQDSTNLKPVTPKVQDMAADGGAVAINCPAGCTPDCAILGNTVLCECKTSNGSTCKAEVVVADDTTVLK